MIQAKGSFISLLKCFLEETTDDCSVGIRECQSIRLTACHHRVPTLRPRQARRLRVLHGRDGWLPGGRNSRAFPNGSHAGCSPGSRREGLEPRLLGRSGAAGEPPPGPAASPGAALTALKLKAKRKIFLPFLSRGLCMEQTGKGTSFVAQDSNTLPSPTHSLYTCRHRFAMGAGRAALCRAVSPFAGLMERELLAGKAEGKQLSRHLSKHSPCRSPYFSLLQKQPLARGAGHPARGSWGAR